jgi:hypothetical protein
MALATLIRSIALRSVSKQVRCMWLIQYQLDKHCLF